ncbi:MAG: tetratricopeptide repeat protein [Anaerolineae bacterium]|nr:tetratricopeptide repeat protein [Anaerolineae bacterium]
MRRAEGDFEAASVAYGQAATLTPGAPGIRTALAEALVECGRLDEAERQFHAAAALAPEDARIAMGLARLALARGAPEQAAQIARAALERNPGNGALHDALGAALEAQAMPEDAAAHYAEATRLAPSLPRPWLRLAANQRANRQHAQARATLEAATAAVPDDADILAALWPTFTLRRRRLNPRATRSRGR